jgi:ATP-dependent protease ClpP protease subunit
MNLILEIKGQLSEKCLNNSMAWASSVIATPGVEPVEIRIDSNGGYTWGTTQFLNALELIKQKREVVTVTGFAASSAAFIFLAGDRRVITQNGLINLHGVEMRMPIWALPTRELPDKDYTIGWQLQNRAERLIMETTSLASAEIEKFMRTSKGKTFDAAMAMKYGIATEVEKVSEGQLLFELAQ